MYNYNYLLLLLAEAPGRPSGYYAAIIGLPILGVAVCVLVILSMLLGISNYRRRKYEPLPQGGQVQGDNQGPGGQ